MSDFLDRQAPSSVEATKWMQTLRDLYATIRDVPWPNAFGESHLEEDRRKALLFTLGLFRKFANENDIFLKDPIEWGPALHDYEQILIVAGEHPDVWYEYPLVLNLPDTPTPQN